MQLLSIQELRDFGWVIKNQVDVPAYQTSAHASNNGPETSTFAKLAKPKSSMMSLVVFSKKSASHRDTTYMSWFNMIDAQHYHGRTSKNRIFYTWSIFILFYITVGHFQ